MQRAIVFIILGTVMLAVVACAAPQAPAPSPATPATKATAVSTPALGTPAAKAPASAPTPDRMAQLIEAAKKEGTVSYAVSPQLLDALEPVRDLVKKKYGVDLNLEASGELNYTRKAAKTVEEVQAGAPNTFDLIDLSENTFPPVVAAGAALKVNWQEYMPQIRKEGIAADGMFLGTFHDFAVPAYNPKVIPAAQAPKTYEDLLDPKWKGRISSPDAHTTWVWLAQPDLWGEAKLKEWYTGLKKQEPFLGRNPEMEARLSAGEYPLSSGIIIADIWTMQRKGIPIEPIIVSPIRMSMYGVMVTKNARNPNAAMLLALSLITPEGQAILDNIRASSLAWVEGTPTAKFAKETRVVTPDQGFIQKNSERLAEELSQIMRGIR